MAADCVSYQHPSQNIWLQCRSQFLSLSALAGSDGQLRPSWMWPKKCHMRMGACKTSCTPTGKKCASWNPLAMLAHRRLRSCRLNSGINAAYIYIYAYFHTHVLSILVSNSIVRSILHLLARSLTHSLARSLTHSLTYSIGHGATPLHPHLPPGMHGD